MIQGSIHLILHFVGQHQILKRIFSNVGHEPELGFRPREEVPTTAISRVRGLFLGRLGGGEVRGKGRGAAAIKGRSLQAKGQADH